jgi:hypothetical protein
MTARIGAGALGSREFFCRPSSVTRYLNTLRSILAYAVADDRIAVNVAASVKPPSGGQARREGVHLTVAQLRDLASACKGPYAELVLVLGLAGLRWGELAGVQVGDRVSVPGPGLRLQRAVLASGGSAAIKAISMRGCGFTTYGTRRRRSGWGRERTRRCCSGCSDTRRRR